MLDISLCYPTHSCLQFLITLPVNNVKPSSIRKMGKREKQAKMHTSFTYAHVRSYTQKNELK